MPRKVPSRGYPWEGDPVLFIPNLFSGIVSKVLKALNWIMGWLGKLITSSAKMGPMAGVGVGSPGRGGPTLPGPPHSSLPIGKTGSKFPHLIHFADGRWPPMTLSNVPPQPRTVEYPFR